MKYRILAFAAAAVLFAFAATAASYYLVVNDFEDGSWRQYTVFTAEGDNPPQNAPCHGIIMYGPETCTSAANCLARAAAPPSLPRCFPLPSEPIYP